MMLLIPGLNASTADAALVSSMVNSRFIQANAASMFFKFFIRSFVRLDMVTALRGIQAITERSPLLITLIPASFSATDFGPTTSVVSVFTA